MDTEGGNALTDVRLAPQLRVLDGIASWCGGLHGSMPLFDALEALAYGFDSECAALTRHHRSEATARPVVICDRRRGEADIPKLGRALAVDVMGYFYDKARASTVWFLSDHVDDADWSKSSTLENWEATREIVEIVVMVLASGQQQSDYIEFHFDRPLQRSEKLEFQSLLPTIVRSWAGRKTGLVTQTRMDARVARARAEVEADKLKWNAPILGMSNPAKLSRAEFRVCLLLARGLSVKGVTEELGLTDATVRTHLRSIYSKTDTASLAELLYRILSAGPDTTEVVESPAERRA